MHLDPVGDQIGVGGIAEHDVGQALTAKSHRLDRVAGGHAAPGKFGIDEAGRDRSPLDPRHADGERQTGLVVAPSTRGHRRLRLSSASDAASLNPLVPSTVTIARAPPRP